MIWKITCYNGTVWESNSQMTLVDALTKFKKETDLWDMDIKMIENLH